MLLALAQLVAQDVRAFNVFNYITLRAVLATLTALIISFIQSGIISAGLTGFYLQFFNGLIIVLALLGHRWNQARYR